MKIYHTETQQDYDALMIELEEQGSKPIPKEHWSVFKTKTTVIVRTKDEEMAERGTTYFGLDRTCARYPNIPIIKYNKKVDL